MDKLSVENESLEFRVLEKHKYPIWVRTFFVFTILIFISVVPSFLLNELPYHCALSQKIANAEECFSGQHYDKAIKLYTEILEKHPNFKDGKIRAAESWFALSSEDVNSYFRGTELLRNEKYTNSEIAEMSTFLPLKYRKHFKSQFKIKPKK